MMIQKDPRSNSMIWMQVGIVSFGSKHGCGLVGVPGVYTKISSYIDWILKHVSIEKKIETPCKDARKGGVSEKCDMLCDYSGKCSETIKTENCGCDGQATFSNKITNYTNGIIVSNSTKDDSGELKTCKDMSSRCKGCFKSSTKYSASAWRAVSKGC